MICDQELRAIFRAAGDRRGADVRPEYAYRYAEDLRVKWRVTLVEGRRPIITVEVPEPCEDMPRSVMEQYAEWVLDRVAGRGVMPAAVAEWTLGAAGRLGL